MHPSPPRSRNWRDGGRPACRMDACVRLRKPCMHVACQVALFLLEKRASAEKVAFGPAKRSKSVCAALLAGTVQADREGNTPLHKAAYSGCLPQTTKNEVPVFRRGCCIETCSITTVQFCSATSSS